jgi:N-acetylneuraminate synthase/N,N'-diacetyllegionaminate synthase
MRRSIVARRRIGAGEVIAAEALTLKRPGTGLAPRYWDVIVGRKAPREIAPDEPLNFLHDEAAS